METSKVFICFNVLVSYLRREKEKIVWFYFECFVDILRKSLLNQQER